MIHTELPDLYSKLNLQVPGESDMTLANMLYDCPNNAKPGWLAENVFKQCVHLEYNYDKLLALVIEKPLGYLTFMVWDYLVWKKNQTKCYISQEIMSCYLRY